MREATTVNAKNFRLGTREERVNLIMLGLESGHCELVKGHDEDNKPIVGMKVLVSGEVYIILDADMEYMLDNGLLVRMH